MTRKHKYFTRSEMTPPDGLLDGEPMLQNIIYRKPKESADLTCKMYAINRRIGFIDKVIGIDISSNGELIAFNTVTSSWPNAGDQEGWEIYACKENKLIKLF